VESRLLELCSGAAGRLDRRRSPVAESPQRHRPAGGGHEDVTLDVLECHGSRSGDPRRQAAGVDVVQLDRVRGPDREPVPRERGRVSLDREVANDAAGAGEQPDATL
jgi:hypothetical protein